MVHAILFASGLPKRLWAEAISTVGYYQNRSATSELQSMSPHEAFTGEWPSEQHLKVFGCHVYDHVPKDERRKLDAKPQKCILLGYGTETKCYRLYNQEDGRIFFSRDVKFNELSLKKQTKEL